MSRTEKVILTNMCLIEDSQGQIVMQIRDPERYAWSGAALPGGHIEAGESLHEAVVREVFEETGLTISHPRLVGMKHWHTKEGIRYLVFLYRTVTLQEKSAQRKREKSSGCPVRICPSWTWPMTCSIYYASLTKMNYPNSFTSSV